MRKQIIHLTVLPMLDSKAQSEEGYVAMWFFYRSKVRWRTKNDENVDFPFPTLSQTSKRVLHEGNISRSTWMEDWIGNIVSFGIAKYQIQRKAIKVLKIEKTGKIRMPPEWYICYLVNDSDPF